MSGTKFDAILSMMSELPEENQNDLVEKIMRMMKEVKTPGAKNNCNNIVKESNFENGRPNCPHCNALANMGYIMKKGFDNGVQRYYCKNCKRYFAATTKTVFENTQKSADVWKKFIHMTISGKSIRACADECDICKQTAFTWRHKILNVFRTHQESVLMEGKIEFDEMFIPISYKGNHVSGDFGGRKRLPGMSNNLPRESFKRGSDNKSSSPNDRACVFCMIKNGNETYFADVPCTGQMKPATYDKTIGMHVKKESSFMLADKNKVAGRYLEDNEYAHMLLASNTSSNPNDNKPEVRDGNHIQHVNAMHHHIRLFLRKYCGVSTKYLANYIALFVWLKNVKANKQQRRLDEVSIYRASHPDCYVTRKELEALPPVPMCA